MCVLRGSLFNQGPKEIGEEKANTWRPLTCVMLIKPHECEWRVLVIHALIIVVLGARWLFA